MSEQVPPSAEAEDHLTWVRTRITLDQEFHEWTRHGFELIAAGFGSFAIFEGLTFGESERSELPRAFALAVTAVGVVAIALAMRHDRRMTAWVDADEFGDGEVPELPDEQRPFYVATAAMVIGVISFVALLFVT